MGALKGTATSRHLDDHHHYAQHIDPRKLVCDQCNTPASYCCTGQCAPPPKRRATGFEVNRVRIRLPSPECDTGCGVECDDSCFHDMLEDCCFQSCEDTDCPEGSTIPCAGDTHCPEQTACADPECEGAPCFEPECGTPPCTEPDCPDNTCEAEGEPCEEDHFDPWACCDLLHSNEDFLNPNFYDDHWSQFHPDQPFQPPYTQQGSSSNLQNDDLNQHGFQHHHQSKLHWNAFATTSQISPNLLSAAGTLNSIEASSNVLSAAEGLALFQHAGHNGYGFQPSNVPSGITSAIRSTAFDQSGMGNFGQPYSPMNHNILPNPSLTPSSTNDQSSINSPDFSECHTPLYGYYSQGFDSLPPSSRAVVKAEPGSDDSTSFTCKWVIPGTTHICNHTATSSEALQNHIRDSHVKLMKGELKCQWHGCRNNGDFKQRSKLTRHVQTHAGYRPHVCTWPGCGQSFGTKQTMDNHLKTHEQVKPYKCRFCNVTATTPTQIKTHENSVHLCKKRFKCRFCEFACTDSSNLSKHEKTHRKRTFRCLHPGCTFKPDCRWENAKRHFIKSGHCPELLVKGSDAQESYKREAMAAAAVPDEEALKMGRLQTYLRDDGGDEDAA